MIAKTFRKVVGQNDQDFVIRDPFLRTIAIGCGLVLAWISFKLSYAFGMTISEEIGLACAAISILSSFAVAIWFAARESLFDLNAMHLLKGFTAVVVGLMCWDFFTNSMTASFQRYSDIELAKSEMQAKDNKGKTVEDLAAQKARLEARKDKLQADFDAMTKKQVGSWSIEVAPLASAAYNDMIAAKKLEQEREGKTGFGPRYQARTNELAHLTALQSLAKAIEDNQADYDRVLTAIANTRNEQGAIEVSQSGANFQSVKAASWLSLATGDTSRKPSALQIAWTEDGMGSLNGIIVAIGAQAFLGLGFMRRSQLQLRRRREDEEPANIALRRTEDETAAARLDMPAMQPMGFVPPAQGTNREVVALQPIVHNDGRLDAFVASLKAKLEAPVTA